MEINVLIEEGIEIKLETERLQKIIAQALYAENLPPEVEISLVITGQARIQELNREYRHIDQPTDVLSFSLTEQTDETEPVAFIGPPDGILHLGEVIVSYPQAVIQAQERHHSIQKEMAALIVHGVLHILGYDHENPEKQSVMVSREKEILAFLRSEKVIE